MTNSLVIKSLVDRALAYWLVGDGFRAGMLIYEMIPVDQRQVWATAILRGITPCMPQVPYMESIIEFGDHPDLWPESRSREAHALMGLGRPRHPATDSW